MLAKKCTRDVGRRDGEVKPPNDGEPRLARTNERRLEWTKNIGRIEGE